MGQSLHLHGGGHLAPLHGVGFHKFHPGRGVVKQAADDDGGAVRAADLVLLGDLSGLQKKAGAGNGSGGLGHQVHTADRCNGS